MIYVPWVAFQILFWTGMRIGELLALKVEYISHIYKAKPETRLFAEKTKSFFEKEIQRGIKNSGVKRITIHCLRHSHASMLVELGFSAQAIAKRLGHGKVTTTIETYCHQSMDAQQKIANTLGKVSNGNGIKWYQMAYIKSFRNTFNLANSNSLKTLETP